MTSLVLTARRDQVWADRTKYPYRPVIGLWSEISVRIWTIITDCQPDRTNYVPAVSSSLTGTRFPIWTEMAEWRFFNANFFWFWTNFRKQEGFLIHSLYAILNGICQHEENYATLNKSICHVWTITERAFRGKSKAQEHIQMIQRSAQDFFPAERARWWSRIFGFFPGFTYKG